MPDYLEYFPKPFLDDLVRGRCIPFIGAGFSKNARLPTGKGMPDWYELGKELSASLPEYEYTTPLDVISAYAHEYSRPKLVEELHRFLLIDTADPGAVHHAFCELPFDNVITTNFDFLLERGYSSLGKYCRPLVDEDHLAIDTVGPHVNLLKLHGDLHHPNRLIATEEDYDSFLESYPLLSTHLANTLISNTALFIGYSLDDPDFRQVWQLIGDRLGKLRRQAYSLVVGAPSHLVSRFARRGVKVINIPGRPANYSTILQEVFEQLKTFWLKEILNTSISTEEDPAAELTIPSGSVGRLCFFAVPQVLAAYYKTTIYPIANRYGLAPVMAIDVVSPGDNINAKISALIEKSEVIVIDLSSPATILEARLGINKIRESDRILIICEEGTDIPFDIDHYRMITRPTQPWTRDANFIGSIESWFGKVSEELGPRLADEPLRLLEKREYRAAVIAAITLLEQELRHHLETNDISLGRRRMLYGSRLIDLAISADILPRNDENKLRKWLAIRNEAVHVGKKTTKQQAEDMVKGIMTLIAQIRRG